MEERWIVTSSGELPEKFTPVELTRIVNGKRCVSIGYRIKDKWVECSLDEGKIIRDDVVAWRIPAPYNGAT